MVGMRGAAAKRKAGTEAAPVVAQESREPAREGESEPYDFYWLASSRVAELSQAKQWNEVIAECNHGLDVPGFAPRAYAMRGLALSELGRDADALADCDRAIELQPLEEELCLIYGIRAQALRNLGRLKEAASDIGRGLELTKRYPFHDGLRRNFRELGESIKARYTGAHGEIMGAAADFAAAARTFSDRELKEYVQKGEVAAAILQEREGGGPEIVSGRISVAMGKLQEQALASPQTSVEFASQKTRFSELKGNNRI
jgi:tetratricopeptide (TPR) repeat protein